MLSDSQDRFLADHEVRLDATSREYGGFLDLHAYLDYFEEAYPTEAQLTDLGVWIGERVFGGLREVLLRHRALPAVAVEVPCRRRLWSSCCAPSSWRAWPTASPSARRGCVSCISWRGRWPRGGEKQPAGEALRMLAAFSLPVRANPLNLRRERYGLQRLVRELNQNRGLAIKLRVLQYGAARKMLEDALEAGEE